ncbi:MAG TPA: metallophosphoesterase [Kribbella sp.]|nr:metallophosphoesterase [Kribbella sp.]
MLVIAHLSDPHLDGTPEARGRLRRVTAYLGALSRPVDVVLVTGDLADHGTETEYAELAAELELEPPVLVLPGNHDVSAPLRAGLGPYLGEVEPADGHPVHQVRDVAGARFVLVDTSVPGEDHGLLSAESLAWLREALASQSGDGPVFVAFHHPPVEIGNPVLDGWMLRDSAGFEAVLREARGVTALLAGHVHGAVVSTFAGLPLLVAPGIRSTAPLPFEPAAAVGLVDVTAPPGLAFHLYEPAEGLRTHYRYLP